MEGFYLCILDKHCTVNTLLNKLQYEFDEDMKCFKILHDGVELQHKEMLSSLLAFKNKEFFTVISKVNAETKLVQLYADVEVQAFVFEEKDRPNSFWTLNSQFYSAQEATKFPSECVAWSKLQVDDWFQWAVLHFKLNQKDSLKIWDFDGKELCSTDPNIFENDTFRAHFKILCQFNFVCSPIQCLDKTARQYNNAVTRFNKIQMVHNQPTSLWEFLLQLLTDKDCKDMILWCDNIGKFKVTDPEKVSMLWGQLNHHKSSSFDSIHRCIVKGTYKDHLVHVPDEKYTYQYVVDISEALGMTPLLIDELRQST